MSEDIYKNNNLVEAFEALSSEKRITAINYLIENPSSEVDELAEHLSEDHRTYQMNMVELQHNHLPRLEDSEIIVHNGDVVELEEPYAELIEELKTYEFLDNSPEIFKALSNSDRIEALNYITENGRTPVERVAEELGTDGSEMYNLNLKLHTAHAPRLEDAGLVQYDKNEIAPTETGIEIMEDLEEIF